LSNDVTAPSSPSLLLPANRLFFAAIFTRLRPSWESIGRLKTKGESPQAGWLAVAKTGKIQRGSRAKRPPTPVIPAHLPRLSIDGTERYSREWRVLAGFWREKASAGLSDGIWKSVAHRLILDRNGKPVHSTENYMISRVNMANVQENPGTALTS